MYDRLQSEVTLPKETNLKNKSIHMYPTSRL
jgi:hypothetical protein